MNMIMLIGFCHTGKWMCPACLLCAKRRVKSASRIPYTQIRHHIARIIYALEKTTD